MSAVDLEPLELDLVEVAILPLTLVAYNNPGKDAISDQARHCGRPRVLLRAVVVVVPQGVVEVVLLEVVGVALPTKVVVAYPAVRWVVRWKQRWAACQEVLC